MQGMIVDWIAHNAANLPAKTAAIELPSGRRRSYADMHDRVGRIARWLTDLGVERGDRVGMLALNSIDTLDIIFATWRIGAVHLALNFRLTAGELDYIIGNAEPKVMIFDAELTETVAALSVTVEHLIDTDGQGGESDFEGRIAQAEPINEMVALEPDDTCMLMYSSGTTGRPKGVVITHGMMLWAQVNAGAPMRCTEDMVSLAVMPLFHIGGLQVFTAPALFAGGTAVIMRSFEPGATLDAFSDPELGITHFLGVPAIFNALRDHPQNPHADLSSLQVVLAGAEAVPEALVQWWSRRGLVVQEGYGMTENVASCCVLGRDDVATKVGSAGKPLRHIELRIAREDGSAAGPGESGEIWCRGPVVTPGYWRRGDANDEAFVDGWFRTGDIGSQDADGFYYVEDRLKDMYISGGENVYPAEIENVLYELEEIREAAVIGVPDERWGETGCAVVVCKEPGNIEAADILAYCRPKLARFKHPTHVVFVDELPRNATGKVLKFELRRTIQP
ncbi:MAG: long-chain fatty acid--CoA ligase [Gammaproteobacteria bacterium]|nr:long-chain fatty acid--CoA ligase [Gammaproteobacteria bacterium]